jgi:hypothetical protein
MRNLVCLAGVIAFGLLLGFAADGATLAKKKSTGKKSGSAVHKKSTGTAGSGARSASATKRGKKGPVRRGTTIARSRQLAPTPERYKEIQQALVAKGYLPPEDANGKWTDSSVEALKKFQTDQNLDGTGKINSLSLIALGLGPKHDTSTAAKPAVPAPAPPVNQ